LGRGEEKKEQILQYVRELESIRPSTIEGYRDLISKAACERYVELIAESVADLIRIIGSEPQMEAFVPKENLERMKLLKGLRNILAHRYGEIEDTVVFDAVRRIPEDVRDFLEHVP